MSLVQLPPIQIVQGQDAFFNATFMEGSTPVVFTGWSGEFTLAHDIRSKAFYRAPVQLGQDGSVSVTLPAAETDAFCQKDAQIGANTVGVFQIVLKAPVAELNEIWQGAIAMAGVIQ